MDQITVQHYCFFIILGIFIIFIGIIIYMNCRPNDFSDLKVGDEFIDKRWKETKLVILNFSNDDSKLIRVKSTDVHGHSHTYETTYTDIMDWWEPLKPNN